MMSPSTTAASKAEPESCSEGRSAVVPGYSSRADLSGATTSSKDILGNTTQSSEQIPERTPSAYSNAFSALTPSTNPSLSSKSHLEKSNSTASVGRGSIKSHVSVSVTGTIPYGSLHVLRPSESLEQGFADSSTMETGPDNDGSGAVVKNTRQKFLESGDVFLILDLPAKFTLGHDAMAVTVENSEMLGIRDVPPGAHFMWVAAPDSISRCGYWYVAAQGRPVIRVKQWDRYNETLGDPASQFEVRERQENIESIYPKLLPHDYQGVPDANGGTVISATAASRDLSRATRASITGPDSTTGTAQIWLQITSAISVPFLDYVTGKKNVAEWLVDEADGAKGEMPDFAHVSSTVSGKFLRSAVGTELNFLIMPDDFDIDRLHMPAVGDTSARILAVHDQLADPALKEAGLVAELQFVFVTGIHLGNFTCLEHWWYLVLKVILRAPQLALRQPSLCRRLIQTILAQLTYNDTYIARNTGETNGETDDRDKRQYGILEFMPRNKRKLRDALALYKRRLDEALLGLGNQTTPEQAAVGQAFLELETWVWTYGWDLRTENDRRVPADGPMDEDDNQGDDDDDDDEVEEDDEYAPVVVDVDDSGREVGLVSWD